MTAPPGEHVRRRLLPPALPVLIGVLTLGPLGFAGCLDESPVDDSFRDARLRFQADDGDLSETFEVPPGNVTLTIGVHYVLEQEATLMAQLIVEAVETHVATIDQFGPVEERDPRWVTIRNATAGSWRLEADLEGGGSYVFAVGFAEQTA